MKIRLVMVILSMLVIGLSCSPQYPDGYLERFHEFEQNWIECYEDRFEFPENPYINGTEYLKCNLDGKNILVNDHTAGFDAAIRYEFGWTTSTPNTPLLDQNGVQNRLQITFFASDYFRQIALIVKYPTDSLNFTIQKTFAHPEFKCATNFVEDSPHFDISTSCQPNGGVLFSTLYSLREDQIIKIDSFSYKFYEGQWYYHLEYSFDEMEITNIHWNANTKIDILGEKKESELLIENLIVKDMKCVIEFELPEG